MGSTMVRWAEREVDSAAAERAYSRPPSTACNHSEGSSSDAQVELQACSLNKKSQYRCCRGLVTPSRAATVGTSKEIVDHGRGMAAASLLAVMCCSTNCKWQASADTSGPGHLGQQLLPLALPSATLLYSHLGVLVVYLSE